MERFIKEYGNYKKIEIASNSLMEEEVKASALSNINKAINLRKRELITVDETIKMIMQV